MLQGNPLQYPSTQYRGHQEHISQYCQGFVSLDMYHDLHDTAESSFRNYLLLQAVENYAPCLICRCRLQL